MGHKCKYKWKLVYGGTAEEGGEERKHYWPVKRMKYTSYAHMSSTKYCLKQGRKKRNRNTMEGVNLFQVLCTHVWNYHINFPSYY
jgi:hypothetical protein